MSDPKVSNVGSVHGEMSNSAWSGRGGLKQLVAELERQKDNTFDFVSDARNLELRVDEGQPRLLRSAQADARAREWIPSEGYPVNDLAVTQLCERVDPAVPIKFLRSLIAERPEIASRLMTDLLARTETMNLVRCLDGRIRAFLSDRYAPLDNYTLAFAAMGVAKDSGAEVVECSLSETNMRIKFADRTVFEKLDEVRQGDRSKWYAGGLGNQEYLGRVSARTGGALPGGPGTIHPLVTIGNSETGGGRLYVRDGLLQAICFNLATVEDVVSNVHLGSRLDPGIFSRETMRKDAEAIMAKASDAIRTAFNPERFRRVVEKVRRAVGVAVKPIEAVDFSVAQGIISEEQRDSLLAHFFGGVVGGETAYGFAQAVARLAQDLEDGDKAAALEDFAGKVISDPSLVGSAA